MQSASSFLVAAWAQGTDCTHMSAQRYSYVWPYKASAREWGLVVFGHLHEQCGERVELNLHTSALDTSSLSTKQWTLKVQCADPTVTCLTRTCPSLPHFYKGMGLTYT